MSSLFHMQKEVFFCRFVYLFVCFKPRLFRLNKLSQNSGLDLRDNFYAFLFRFQLNGSHLNK